MLRARGETRLFRSCSTWRIARRDALGIAVPFGAALENRRGATHLVWRISLPAASTGQARRTRSCERCEPECDVVTCYSEMYFPSELSNRYIKSASGLFAGLRNAGINAILEVFCCSMVRRAARCWAGGLGASDRVGPVFDGMVLYGRPSAHSPWSNHL